MVRTAEEWSQHPQGAAVGALARVEVDKIGESPAEPVSDALRPLGGVRVLDLTRILAGPTNGRTLAEHGADVLLVNSPALDNVLPFVMDTSHGKRSTFLDLDGAEDVARLRALVPEADVFAQGYRSGAMERRGLSPQELAEIRPGIVYVTMNCYGDVGPWRQRPGWEQLAQSVSGIAAVQGGDGPPTLIPAAACDYTTGYLAALGTDRGVVAAQPRRRQLSRPRFAVPDRGLVRGRAAGRPRSGIRIRRRRAVPRHDRDPLWRARDTWRRSRR